MADPTSPPGSGPDDPAGGRPSPWSVPGTEPTPEPPPSAPAWGAPQPGPSAPPGYGQPPYGQPPYGQPPYGQPPYGQPGSYPAQPYGWYPQPPPRRGIPGWAWALIAVGGLAVLAVAALVAFVVIGAVSGPDGYGDDPALDRLWDECEAGDMAACDDLYSDAPFFSDYESFGDTCGRRTGGGTDCTDEFE